MRSPRFGRAMLARPEPPEPFTLGGFSSQEAGLPTQMPTEQDRNEAIACRFLDLVADHDVDALVAMVTPTWTMEGGPPDLPPGEAGIRTLFDSFGRIQQEWTVDDVIAEGHKVVVRATCIVEQDSFFGVPAAGRQQRFTATFIHDVVDGRIIRTRRNADDLGRLLQLGARIVPSSAPPGR